MFWTDCELSFVASQSQAAILGRELGGLSRVERVELKKDEGNKKM